MPKIKHVFNTRNEIKKLVLPGMLVLMLLLFVSFTESRMKDNTSGYLQVLMENPAIRFLSTTQVERMVKQQEGLTLMEVENALNGNPYVKRSEVFRGINGHTYVRLTQREAFLRVFNAAGESYYIDRDGIKFPVSPSFAPYVMVVTGSIGESYNGTDSVRSRILKDAIVLQEFLSSHPFYNSLAGQIEVTRENDFVIIPRIGNERIIIGDINELEEKFGKLVAFYRSNSGTPVWNTYRTLNLKFKNQIIANR